MFHINDITDDRFCEATSTHLLWAFIFVDVGKKWVFLFSYGFELLNSKTFPVLILWRSQTFNMYCNYYLRTSFDKVKWNFGWKTTNCKYNELKSIYDLFGFTAIQIQSMLMHDSMV